MKRMPPAKAIVASEKIMQSKNGITYKTIEKRLSAIE